jgi:Uma2 family endonuclease
MATASEPRAAIVTGHPPCEITTDEFFRLIEAGVFEPHRRIYLWDGRLCEAMAKTAAHAHLANLFNKAIARRLPEGWFLSVENPLSLTLKDAPLPDFAVVQGDPMAFLEANRHVEPREVGLVVEVAVTSLPADMGDRRSKYALAMPDGAYIVIDFKNRRFLVHTEPAPDPEKADEGTWGKVTTVGPGELIHISLRGQEIEPIPWEEVMR